MSEATNNEVEWPQTDRRHHIVTNMLLAVGVAPLVIMLHEYAHAVAQLLLGAGGSTVRALSAEAATALPAASQGWSAAAGPPVLARLGPAGLGGGPPARYRTPRGMLMAVHWPVLWASLLVIALTAVLAAVSGYGVGIVIAMVTSTMSMYVAALMSSLYWGRFTHRSLDKSVGRLVPAAVFAGTVVVVWVLHGIIGVTLG